MSLNTKLSVILLFVLLSSYSYGQKYTVHQKKKSYFGLLGGMNFSFPKVTDKYAVLTPGPLSKSSDLEKKYDNFFQNRGTQFGIHYKYHISNPLSLVMGLGYESIGFGYLTHYSWTDTINKFDFNREMHHLQKISYFNLPIKARYDLTKGQFKPYVQGGMVLNFRHQGNKVIHYDNTIDEEETENQLSSSPTVSITEYTKKFNFGLTAGVGISYHTKWITLGLESNFQYGFRKIMNDGNLYADLNGFALQYLDVLDQLRTRNVNVQLSASIPINSAVHLNILRRRRY